MRTLGNKLYMPQVTGAKTSMDSLPVCFLRSGPSSRPPGQQQAFGKYFIKKGTTSCKSRDRNSSAQPPGCTQVHERALKVSGQSSGRGAAVWVQGTAGSKCNPIFWLWKLRPREDGEKKNSRLTECLLGTGKNTRPCPPAVRTADAPPKRQWTSPEPR